MWSMWDAPSDRDYYGQFNPYPEEEESVDDEAEMVCEHGRPADLPCSACDELALAGFPGTPPRRPCDRTTGEEGKEAAS